MMYWVLLHGAVGSVDLARQMNDEWVQCYTDPAEVDGCGLTCADLL